MIFGRSESRPSRPIPSHSFYLSYHLSLEIEEDVLRLRGFGVRSRSRRFTFWYKISVPCVKNCTIRLPPPLSSALQKSRSHWSMNLHFLVAFLIPGLLATVTSGEIPAVGGELVARGNAEPLPRWIPHQQAEATLAETKVIRGLLIVRQSDCSGMYTCGTG